MGPASATCTKEACCHAHLHLQHLMWATVGGSRSLPASCSMCRHLAQLKLRVGQLAVVPLLMQAWSLSHDQSRRMVLPWGLH